MYRIEIRAKQKYNSQQGFWDWTWMPYGGAGLLDYEGDAGLYECLDDAKKALLEIFDFLSDYYTDKSPEECADMIRSRCRIMDIENKRMVNFGW